MWPHCTFVYFDAPEVSSEAIDELERQRGQGGQGAQGAQGVRYLIFTVQFVLEIT
jgi:hypothetical protein